MQIAQAKAAVLKKHPNVRVNAADAQPTLHPLSDLATRLRSGY